MMMDVRRTDLSNGLCVITARMPQVSSVAIGLWVGAGGRHESPEESGVSHFLEHLLFKGTRRRTAQEISREIEGRGGYLNAFTQEESTCYYARVASEHAWTALDVLTDMYLDPKLAEEDIAKERGVILEEIMMYRDQPQHVAEETLGELLWADHALGRPLTGTPENLGRVGRGVMRRYLRTHYVPARTVAVFAGAVDHEACVKRVERLLGARPAGAAPAWKKVTAAVKQKPVALIGKAIEQTHVAMGFRLFGRRHPDRYALRVLSVALGENMSSRLFHTVRERHGLAYSIHSGAQLFDETGVLSVSAGLDRKRTMRALDLIVGELNKMKMAPMSGAELRRAKDYAVGQLRLSLEGTANQMLWVGDNILSYGRFIPPEEIIAQVEAVTSQDVMRVAGDVFRSCKASLAVVAPAESGLEEHRLITGMARLD